MLADLAKARLEAAVDVLMGRIQTALELTALVAESALPNAPVSAYLVPAGIRPVSGGESAAGAYTQELEEQLALVLVVNSAADVTGGKAAPRLDDLVWRSIEALAGWQPDEAADEATLYLGPMAFSQSQLVSLTKGAAISQVEFTIPLQLRIL